MRPPNPNAARVLAAMTPGTVYETRDLATATDLGMSNVRHVLTELARVGAVTRIEPLWRGLAVGWHLPAAPPTRR